MKYYKLGNQVYAFEEDGSQDEVINSDYVKMTDDEIDRHINPDKYLSDDEKEHRRLLGFKPLTKRQFKLGLLDHDLLEVLEATISSIEDVKLKTRLSIEYNDSETFERANNSIISLFEIVGLTTNQIDKLWIYSSAL